MVCVQRAVFPKQTLQQGTEQGVDCTVLYQYPKRR